MLLHDVICRAIRERVALEFEYDGHHRVVVPYCHGMSRSGEALRAIQIGGTSQSGGFGFGKLWSVAKMRNVRSTGASFVPDDPDYNPDDRAMVRIHCRI